MWSFGLALFMNTDDLNLALRYSILYYMAPAFVVLTFLYFALFFLKEKIKIKEYIYFFIPFFILLIGFIFDKNLIIREIYISENGKEVVLNKLNYIYYVIYILFYVGTSYYVLFKAKNKNKNNNLKTTQLNFIITGTSISYIFAMFFNLFLPYFGNYNLIWLGPPFTIIMILLTSYAILKHHLFNLKLVLTEVFVFLLWIILSIELFLSDNIKDFLVELFLLTTVIIFGILLIKSVSKEVKRREETEKLANDLMEANEKLKKLDKEKSDFISVASHQLRTPLTAIKGYASMILEGTYGKVPKKVKETVDKVFQSSQRLVYIVNDMLDVSRIEQGRIKYNFEDVKLADLVRDVCDELKVNAKAKKLKLAFNTKQEDKNIVVSADYGKLRQAITNVIDNSIKYTDAGFVLLSMQKDDQGEHVILSIKDSGIGISKENMKFIFDKFERASNAQKTHTEGSGLGLYVAKEIIKAHDGVIWATSEGVGKGSQFYIELPIKSSQ